MLISEEEISDWNVDVSVSILIFKDRKASRRRKIFGMELKSKCKS